MTDYRKYTDYIIEQAEKLLSIDSPSGYCRQVTDYLLEELKRLGIQAERTIKCGVVASLGAVRKRRTVSSLSCATSSTLFPICPLPISPIFIFQIGRAHV